MRRSVPVRRTPLQGSPFRLATSAPYCFVVLVPVVETGDVQSAFGAVGRGFEPVPSARYTMMMLSESRPEVSRTVLVFTVKPV